MTTTVKATEVRIRDRLRTPTGLELTVTRIDHGLLGRADFTPDYTRFVSRR